MIAVVPLELILLAAFTIIVFAVMGGIAALVSRYGSSRKDQGEAGAEVEAYERAIEEAGKRETKAREERSKSHEQWKADGAKRRKTRPARKPRARR